jgi:hypothetical protein
MAPQPAQPLQKSGRDALRREWMMHPAGAFEKRKIFQRVYCSISTPSYIWSTRRIWVSRL